MVQRMGNAPQVLAANNLSLVCSLLLGFRESLVENRRGVGGIHGLAFEKPRVLHNVLVLK